MQSHSVPFNCLFQIIGRYKFWDHEDICCIYATPPRATYVYVCAAPDFKITCAMPRAAPAPYRAAPILNFCRQCCRDLCIRYHKLDITGMASVIKEILAAVAYKFLSALIRMPRRKKARGNGKSDCKTLPRPHPANPAFMMKRQ